MVSPGGEEGFGCGEVGIFASWQGGRGDAGGVVGRWASLPVGRGAGEMLGACPPAGRGGPKPRLKVSSRDMILSLKRPSTRNVTQLSLKVAQFVW